MKAQKPKFVVTFFPRVPSPETFTVSARTRDEAAELAGERLKQKYDGSEDWRVWNTYDMGRPAVQLKGEG